MQVHPFHSLETDLGGPHPKSRPTHRVVRPAKSPEVPPKKRVDLKLLRITSVDSTAVTPPRPHNSRSHPPCRDHPIARPRGSGSLNTTVSMASSLTFRHKQTISRWAFLLLGHPIDLSRPGGILFVVPCSPKVN